MPRVREKKLRKQKTTVERAVYFENQKNSNLCRMHAINNALGKLGLSKKRFWALCDNFDMNFGTKGSREFFMCHSEHENMFTFMLRDIGANCRTYNGRINDDILMECHAIICYSDEHSWSLRKYNQQWYKLDSLESCPIPVNPLINGGCSSTKYILITQ